MAACGDDPPPGEDAALYDTVKAVGMELCPALGIGVPVGKDSLSMRTHWQARAAQQKKVTSPVSLIVSAFATLADVRGTLTPQLAAGRHHAAAGRPRAGPQAHGRHDPGAGARPGRRRACPTSTIRSW